MRRRQGLACLRQRHGRHCAMAMRTKVSMCTHVCQHSGSRHMPHAAYCAVPSAKRGPYSALRGARRLARGLRSASRGASHGAWCVVHGVWLGGDAWGLVLEVALSAKMGLSASRGSFREGMAGLFGRMWGPAHRIRPGFNKIGRSQPTLDRSRNVCCRKLPPKLVNRPKCGRPGRAQLNPPNPVDFGPTLAESCSKLGRA